MTESTSNDALSVDTTPDGVIVVQGDIDMAGGPVLDAAIVRQESEQPVVIDIAGVSFIDSSGLRSLLDAGRRAKTRGTEVVLRNMGPEVARLLEITGTADQFNVESRRD
jgi:anti-sigma B factor antagonist